MRKTLQQFGKLTATLLLSATVYGCSSTNTANSEDPYETFNRHSYAMNKTLDDVLIRPVTSGYASVTPQPVQDGVHNFFENIDQIFITFNSLLQADFSGAGTSTGRFLINTTLGIGGLFDVATKMGVNYHYTDFGLTLAKYGVKDSPYLMVPFFGPSTVRDSFGILVDDILLSPMTYVPLKYFYISYPLFALEVIDKRAQYLDQDQLLEQAFDPYIFLRSAYMQNRNHMIQQMDSGNRIQSQLPEKAARNPQTLSRYDNDVVYLDDE